MQPFSAANRPERVQILFPLPSITIQSPKDDSDINQIMEKFQRTGLIEHVQKSARYENLPDVIEFHEAMNIVLEAEKSFEGLPSTVRREFDNDPAKFLAFIDDPANVDRMAALGLLNAPPAAAPAVDDETTAKAVEAPAEGT